MNKLANIMVAIAQQPDGIVLIDEIENGLYHSKLSEVWKALLEFARHFNCQIFATTHSSECLKAVASLAEESPEDFMLMRTVQEDGKTVIRTYDGRTFADAITDNVDVR